MPKIGKGHITIHLPEKFFLYINGTEYTDYALNYEFIEQQNIVGEFTVDLIAIGSAQRADVQRGSVVQLRFAENLVFKGIIERADYKTDEECTIKGYGAVETKLKNVVTRITASSDTDSLDGRPSYSGTTSGVASTTIVAEQISGVSTVYIGTNNYLGHLVVRGEYDNVLSFLDSVARNMSGVWWTSYGDYPYETNFFNISSSREDTSVKKDFYLTGSNQNAIKTDREVDEESLWTSVVYLGYGDGVNQVQSRIYHATDNFTRLVSGCSASDTVLTVDSTNGFESSTVFSVDDWETGTIDADKWTLINENADIGGGELNPDYAIVTSGVFGGSDYSLWMTPGSAFLNCGIKTKAGKLPVGRVYSFWVYGADGVGTTDGYYFYLGSDADYSKYIMLFTDWDIGTHGDLYYRVSGDTSTKISSGGDNSERCYNGNWYKFEITYEAMDTKAIVTVYSGVAAAELVSEVVEVGIPFTPAFIKIQDSTSVGAYRGPRHVENIAVDKYGLWVGSEYLTYTGKDTAVFKGCIRAARNDKIANQNYKKAYAHSRGVAVFDAAYTEDATDGNSKIDSYGLKQKVVTDKRITDQDSLDQTATNWLVNHYGLSERITLAPADLYDCLKTLVVGDIVSVTDDDSGLSGNYQIVGQRFKSNMGAEELEYELNHIRSTLTQDLREAKQEAKVTSQYGQGSTTAFNATKYASGTASSPYEIRVYLPNDVKGVIKANLDYQISGAANSDVYVGKDGTGSLGLVSGTYSENTVSLDVSDWIVSGITLSDGNWMIARVAVDSSVQIDGALYVKAFVEAK